MLFFIFFEEILGDNLLTYDNLKEYNNAIIK